VNRGEVLADGVSLSLNLITWTFRNLVKLLRTTDPKRKRIRNGVVLVYDRHGTRGQQHLERVDGVEYLAHWAMARKKLRRENSNPELRFPGRPNGKRVVETSPSNDLGDRSVHRAGQTNCPTGNAISPQDPSKQKQNATRSIPARTSLRKKRKLTLGSPAF